MLRLCSPGGFPRCRHGHSVSALQLHWQPPQKWSFEVLKFYSEEPQTADCHPRRIWFHSSGWPERLYLVNHQAELLLLLLQRPVSGRCASEQPHRARRSILKDGRHMNVWWGFSTFPLLTQIWKTSYFVQFLLHLQGDRFFWNYPGVSVPQILQHHWKPLWGVTESLISCAYSAWQEKLEVLNRRVGKGPSQLKTKLSEGLCVISEFRLLAPTSGEFLGKNKDCQRDLV